MKTLEFLLGRALKAALVVLGVVILNFLLIHLAPGDPATVIAGEAGSGDLRFLADLRQQFGLDRPLPVQLGLYLKSVLAGDLGYSYRNHVAVTTLIAERLPATLLLALAAFVFSMALGVPLGAYAALRHDRPAARLLNHLAVLVHATPLYWLALMAVLLFSIQLDWLPAFGIETIGGGLHGWARGRDIAWHLVLPATTLGLFFAAIYVRLTRATVLEVMALDFVKTARAKGVPPLRLALRHVLRNALLPVFSFAGVKAGQLVGGTVLAETVFAWPGLGRLMFDALIQRDYAVLLGVFLVTSSFVVLINLATDLLYRVVDPRIETA